MAAALYSAPVPWIFLQLTSYNVAAASEERGDSIFRVEVKTKKIRFL